MGALAAWLGGGLPQRKGRCAHGVDVGGPHPRPRPGVNASRVLSAAALQGHGAAILAFGEVRLIPEIVDGIRCHCGCADDAGSYSLLSCYEGEGMAQHCDICQGQARMAYRLHRAGKSLGNIREAIDARYG
ncbi:MAG: hypothetical protein NVS4B3_03580 [Gemmatimonadaceae bacterium]